MPTTKERISLANDSEEITAVKAPPPGLLRESMIMAAPGSGLIVIDEVDEATEQPTPGPIVNAASRAAGSAATTRGAVAHGAPSPASAATRLPLPAARVTSLPARVAAPVPIAATLVASYQTTARRPVVDLVPVAPGRRALAFAPAATTYPAPVPARSRAGLYGVLAALLIGGAGLIGWRQWSARPGRVEITTLPADAVISVGSEALDEQSPALLERPPGTYEISVAREGYQHTHRTVELRAGQDLALSVSLTPVAADTERPAIADAPQPARAVTAGSPAPRRAQVAAGSGSRSAAGARTGARPDPGIAAMLAARSGLLRDLSPATPAAGSPSEPAPGSTPSPESNGSPTAATPPTLAIETADEPAPPAPAPRAVAAAAPTDPGGVAGAPEIAGARTISSRIARGQLMIDPNADEYRVALPPSLARAEMKLAAVVKICVSTEGKVASVKLLKSADPAVDPQIPAVLGRWRFRPLLVGNRPAPFCYTTQYEISDR